MKRVLWGLIVMLVIVMILCIWGILKNNHAQCIGHISKHDSLFIESVTGREIIDFIDSTLLSPSDYNSFKYHILKDRKYVKQCVSDALNYNISDRFCVVYFFYDEDFSCPWSCPELYVWLSDYEKGKLYKHIKGLSEGDSVMIVNGDTIHRKIEFKHIYIKSSISGFCSNSCFGYTTILMFNPLMNNIIIHHHHRLVCQTHDSRRFYERFWDETQRTIKAHKRGIILFWEKKNNN